MMTFTVAIGNTDAHLRNHALLLTPETAATLNCSVGTVKSQASRALVTLRRSAELVDGDR